MTTGFVLSGGGARGISHLGVVKALAGQGIVPEILSGTSAGAIIGAFLAAGYDPDEILRIIRKTSLLKAFLPAFSLQGLLKMTRLEKLLNDMLPAEFAGLQKPLTVAATDIYKGELVYLTDGPLVPAVLASACVPVIFKPIKLNGRQLVDGGLLNNLPAEALHGKVDRLIAISCNPGGPVSRLPNARALMERSALLAINGNVAPSKQLCDVFIEPPELVHYSGFGLSQAQAIFKVGYDYTRENLHKFAL